MVGSSLFKLQKGKAASSDEISPEHLLYSHPILISLLTLLFNTFLQCGRVPNSFRQGVIIPVLKSNTSDASKEENYRGITISSTLSKIFEVCLKVVFSRFLETEELQIGFKAGVGCRDAILTARSAIQYHTNHGDTVTVCALDISKAFDRVDFYCLFLKLMKRNVPKVYLHLIVNWYVNCSAVVKWDNFLNHSIYVLV